MDSRRSHLALQLMPARPSNRRVHQEDKGKHGQELLWWAHSSRVLAKQPRLSDFAYFGQMHLRSLLDKAWKGSLSVLPRPDRQRVIERFNRLNKLAMCVGAILLTLSLRVAVLAHLVAQSTIDRVCITHILRSLRFCV